MENQGAIAPISPNQIIGSVRDGKIADAYNGSGSVCSRMSDPESSVEEIMQALLYEFAREIDKLAGNERLAIDNGEIERATVISVKRAEVIDKMVKAFMSKKEFDSTTSIDVESPSMRVVFHFFLQKCQESFDKSGMSSEVSNLFFRNLTEVMANWKKELKRRIVEMRM